MNRPPNSHGLLRSDQRVGARSPRYPSGTLFAFPASRRTKVLGLRDSSRPMDSLVSSVRRWNIRGPSATCPTTTPVQNSPPESASCATAAARAFKIQGRSPRRRSPFAVSLPTPVQT